jgi:hypothetical protein
MTARMKPSLSATSNGSKAYTPTQLGSAYLSASLMNETMVWILTILSSVSIYLLLATIIHSVYHPDIKPLLEKANKLLFITDAARPEPVESLLTRVGIVSIGLSLLGFYPFFSRRVKLDPEKHSKLFTGVVVLCAVALLALIFVDFAAQNPFCEGGGDTTQNERDKVAHTNFDFFFGGLFLGNYLLVYLVICVPLLAALFFVGYRKNEWEQNRLNNLLVSSAGYFISGLIIIAIIGMNTFYFPYTYENKYNFEAVYYSMTQVYAGSAMLVDGFTNTYGLYPHFLNPLFKLIGLSILKFSMVMAILTALAFVFNFYVLKRFTSNRLILFLGFMTVLFFPYLDSKLVTKFDSQFALFPIRYIVPSLLIFLTTIYLHRRTRIFYWLTTALMSFAVLWNPEIGLVSFLSWLAVNCYADFYSEEGKIAYGKMLFHVIGCISVLIGVFILYASVIYVVYGAFPQLSLLFSTIAVFGSLGFNLLPMAVIHPWHLMVLVLIFGFVYAVSKLYRREVAPKSSIIFLLSVIGLGFFLYFQGRSHNWSFASTSGFSIVLLVLLGDELWQKVRTTNGLAFPALFVVFLLVISFSGFELVYSAATINSLVFPEETKAAQLAEQQQLEGNRDFVANNTVEGEKILVLTTAPREGLYFDGSKRVSVFNPCFIEMFFLKGVDYIEERIKRNGPNRLFIEAFECKFTYMIRDLLAMSALYDVAKVNGGIAMLEKRTKKMPAKVFFNRGAALLHRKYTADSASIEARINDGLGAAPVRPDSIFNVQILFYANQQLCPTSTLIGNRSDSGGFIIEKKSSQDRYFFGLNGIGLEGQIPDKLWIYCVMNVFPTHIDVYLNGVKTGTSPLSEPYRQSAANVYIGSQSLGSVAYYVGAISEAAITNGAINETVITETWQDITKNTEY